MQTARKIFLVTLWSVTMTSCGGSEKTAQLESPEETTGIPETPYWESAERMEQACSYHLGEAEFLRIELASTSPDGNEEKAVKQFDRIMMHVDKMAGLSELVANVHPERGIREAAEKCQQAVDKFITGLSLDRDVYETFSEMNLGRLNPQGKRIGQRVLRDLRRAGVDKDEETRNRLAAIKEEMVSTGQDFLRNIREDTRFIELDSADDLAGMPLDYVSSHAPGENGKIKISTEYPDFLPVVTYAGNEQLRRDIYIQFLSRAHPVNIELLEKILKLRREYVSLLGYEDWAAYNAEDKMVKTADVVEDFIDRVSAIARPRMQQDMEEILARKKQDNPDTDGIHMWDRFYYVEKIRKEKYGVDSQEVRAYFPYNQVKEGVLSVLEKIFSVTINNVDREVWHPSVEAFEVRRGDEIVGVFYLDMHPRDDKYGHAGAFTIQSGIQGEQLPQGALVCNFPNPAEGPALMEHSQVTTLFHEFGHLMHHLLSGHHKYVLLSGFEVEWDFIEVPSQLLEEWAWDPGVLATFAHHHETRNPIPGDLVKKMKAADEFGKGVHVMRQMALAALSLGYHRGDPATFDLDAKAREINEKYSPYPYEEGTYLYCNFGHLEGYSSAYYTYMWSLYLVKDAFTRFKEKGLMNASVAHELDNCIYSAGSAQDADEMMNCFLGREPSFDAFKDWLQAE